MDAELQEPTFVSPVPELVSAQNPRTRPILAVPSSRHRRPSVGGAMIAPARIAAYEALIAVSAGSADLPTAIAFARGQLHDERDRALASDIATGVLRWRGGNSRRRTLGG